MTGAIATFLQQDVLESWGSEDCASLVAPLLGGDSAFDTTTSVLSSENLGRTTGESMAPIGCAPSSCIPDFGKIGLTTVGNKAGACRSNPERCGTETSPLPQVSSDNEPPLISSRQRALQRLSRATMYGARPASDCQGQSVPSPLCESFFDRRGSAGSDADSIRTHGISMVGSSGTDQSLSGNKRVIGCSEANEKEDKSAGFLKTPYDFSMSRTFKFSDGSKINVPLESAL